MPAQSPVLTLAQYQALVAHLPRPSAQQMHDFAVFIGNAHSWYKHLPLLPPGRPLRLFLDPAAGMQLTIGADGRAQATVRERPGFHYSWLPTREHRERFGYLAFARHNGTQVSLATAAGTRDVGSDDFPCVFDGSTQSLRPLPAEVLHAGRARISGLVHTLGTAQHRLLMCLEENPDVVWPEESGGQAGRAKILARCRDLLQGVAQTITMSMDDPRLWKDYNCISVDATLYDLLEPERRRQRNGLVAAMTQMLRLLEPA